MAGKDTAAIKADSSAVTQAGKPGEPTNPPAPGIVKHDTIYVAVKEMPEENVWTLPTIITIILAAISLFTLLEMKAQRLTTYKPELILASDKFFTRESGEEISYGIVIKDSMNENSYLTLKEIYLKLFNIGASAKNVEISYSYNLNTIVPLISNFIHVYSMEDMEYYHLNRGIKVGNIKLDGAPIELIGATFTSFKYILNATYLENKGIEIFIPTSYIQFLLLCMKTKQDEMGSAKFFEHGYIPIYYTIKYDDIHNNGYTKVFEIEPAFSSFSKLNSAIYIEFILKIKEIGRDPLRASI
jgi:hypothetical protein